MSDLQHPPHHTRPNAAPDGSNVELPAEAARQGESRGHMRYVLFGSLIAIVPIFLALWLGIARF